MINVIGINLTTEIYFSALRRLEKPVLDLDTRRTIPYISGPTDVVAALPGGEAVFSNYTYMYNNSSSKLLKLDSQGKVTQVIYSCADCNSVNGLLVLGDYLYALDINGKILEIRVSDGSILSRTKVNVHIVHKGSLHSKPDKIPDKQTLLLCDIGNGEVVTFKPSTGQKKVPITGLITPRSVSYLFYNNTVYYIVCEEDRHMVTVYNNTWDRIRTIGRRGSNDGELNSPMSAIVSDEDTIIIADYDNHRISEFSFNGTFLHHLLDRSDGVYRPEAMSYYYPHLWLRHGNPNFKLYRYNLYG